MFSFLNSTILFAAAAAMIPLIIHLFSKRRVKIVEFSSLKHLKQMQRRQVRRLKIRQLLLLLLRMLIILLVVLAFARPTIESGAIGSHASVSAVILFDNSASMNRYVADGNLFDIARKKTQELLETFGEADQVSVIPLSGYREETATPLFTSAATASEKLKQVEIGYQPADLQSALETSLALLDEAQNLNKEIYIVTDRQSSNLPEQRVLSGSEARLFFVDLPLERNDNLGITAVDFGGQLIMPGHDFDLTATITNYGNEDRSDVIASLFIDNNRLAQTAFSVNAGQETTVRFARSVSQTGFHSGYVELSDDKFVTDNRYYFSFHLPQKFNLLVINGDRSGPFMSLALSPSASVNQYWSMKEVSPEMLSGVNFRDYDVVFLAGTPVLSEVYLRRLKSYVKAGNSLFLSCGPQTDTDHFNRHWSEVTSVVIDEPIRTDFSRAGYYTFLSIDFDHPIFSVFRFEDNRPPEVKFYTLPKMHVTGDGRVLARFTGDRPALVESTYGGSKILTFTGPMAPGFSDITSHAFFVPFVSRLAEYLASDLSSFDVQLYAGENITRSVSLKGSVNAPLEMSTPDSSVFGIPPEEKQGALVLRARPTDRPGIYRVSYLGREIDRFAINTDPSECNLARSDIDQMAMAMGADDYNVLETGADLSGEIAEMRFGKELWQLFLWLAVIIILVEILLSRATTSKDQS